MVSHFLVLAFAGSFKNLKTSGRMCLQGLGLSCRVWMVGHFLDVAFDGSFENLKTSGRMCLQGLGFSCRTHVPAGFRV